MSHKKALKPTVLAVIDGLGIRQETSGNAVAQAKMPFLDFAFKNFPSTKLAASGAAVGLPPGFIGNSEVGHLTLGAGRTVKGTLIKFHESIEDETLKSHPVLEKHLSPLVSSNGRLHLMGLFSDAGVHSHTKHIKALVDIAAAQGNKNIFIHAFLDGRDSPPKSAGKFLSAIQDHCHKVGVGNIASIHGRFYSMDRDNNWERIKKSYDVLCSEQSISKTNWKSELEKAYSQKITDEFVEPVLLSSNGIIKPGDGVIFFNIRPDRARQLTRCFVDPEFKNFKTTGPATHKCTLKFFITTTLFDPEFKNLNNEILFEENLTENTLLDVIAQQPAGNKKVIIAAENEKKAHVTYFFRGQRTIKLPHEHHIIVPSIKAKNYIDQTEMSADLITEDFLKSVHEEPPLFALINYANPDMVGHSGNLEATIKACECVDRQLKKLFEEIVVNLDGTLFITSDHGNAEEMASADGSPLTSHSSNPVPMVMVNNHPPAKQQPAAKKTKNELKNVAPTILKHLGLKKPDEMENGIDFG
jgi:2,3-bisphosphoglycerate-independent phosphoglycerate mutase